MNYSCCQSCLNASPPKLQIISWEQIFSYCLNESCGKRQSQFVTIQNSHIYFVVSLNKERNARHIHTSYRKTTCKSSNCISGNLLGHQGKTDPPIGCHDQNR